MHKDSQGPAALGPFFSAGIYSARRAVWCELWVRTHGVSNQARELEVRIVRVGRAQRTGRKDPAVKLLTEKRAEQSQGRILVNGLGSRRALINSSAFDIRIKFLSPRDDDAFSVVIVFQIDA